MKFKEYFVRRSQEAQGEQQTEQQSGNLVEQVVEARCPAAQ